MDIVSDDLFRVTIGVRFRHREEGKWKNVDRLLDVLGEGRGKIPMNGLLGTSDRGYGWMELLKTFLQKKIGVIMIFPNHPI